MNLSEPFVCVVLLLQTNNRVCDTVKVPTVIVQKSLSRWGSCGIYTSPF